MFKMVLPFCMATPAVGAAPIRIVGFGDSTTATRASVKQVYCRRLAEILPARGMQVEVINAGIGGNTTDQARGRFEKDVLARKPHVVIIQFGLNDSAVNVFDGKTEPRVDRARYDANLRHFAKTLKDRGIRVILMTPNSRRWTPGMKERYGKPPYDPGRLQGFNVLLDTYAETVRQVARTDGVPLIDVYAIFESRDEPAGRLVASLLPDGIHPNDEGHRIIADLLAERILSICGLKPRGYSIPLVDLAGDKHRQVVVDREPGQYLGHPTTVLLEDNKTMITVYPKGHGRGGVVMRRSTDGGLTWSDRLPVPDNWATSQEVPTIHRVIDAKGTKRLIMFSGLYPIRMAVSEDDGVTWTPLEPIGDFGGIVTMASVVRLKNGSYMALFHDDGRFLRGAKKRTKFQVFKTVSTDGGLTWSQPVVIAQHPTAHLCEPGAVRSPDGKQLAVLLRENSRKHNSFVIFTDDEGKTWSPPVELPGALTGDRHTGRYASDGRLFITFRDTTHESPTKGDWVGWVGKYEDIVAGREGQYRVRLMDNTRGADCAYPGLELLPDGTFVTTTYGHWVKGEMPFIVSVRFKIEEIDKRAAASR